MFLYEIYQFYAVSLQDYYLIPNSSIFRSLLLMAVRYTCVMLMREMASFLLHIVLGSNVALQAWTRAQQYING